MPHYQSLVIITGLLALHFCTNLHKEYQQKINKLVVLLIGCDIFVRHKNPALDDPMSRLYNNHMANATLSL